MKFIPMLEMLKVAYVFVNFWLVSLSYKDNVIWLLRVELLLSLLLGGLTVGDFYCAVEDCELPEDDVCCYVDAT